MSPLDHTIDDVIGRLAAISPQEQALGLRGSNVMPQVETIAEVMRLIGSVIFPGLLDRPTLSEQSRPYRIGVDVENILTSLARQIAFTVAFECDHDEVRSRRIGIDKARRFIATLPEIRRLLLTDVEAMVGGDPAVKSAGEVVYSYPVVQVMLHYRVAHELHRLGVPIIPRIITEQAHSATGIDIHPAAQIGEYFAIDHGTGVVIGATTIIGKHVSIYQGVTLGAKSFKRDDAGRLLDVPRHPIIEDYVTIYSNASILGRITIGHHSVIGGNVWLDRSVLPHSRILQGKPIEQQHFEWADGI